MNALRVCPLLLLLIAAPLSAAEPLALHPANGHYFVFRGKPAVLVGSGEHYGAVLNRKFDYVRYLDELKRAGLNHTRTFSGAYVEPQGSFGIAKNTLAPGADFIAPWARSDNPGYPGGGNKFDLDRWDDAYFARLRDFAKQASERGVVIELNLFCPFYEDAQWKLSPQNAANNVNGIGKAPRTDVYTLDKNGGLLTVHDKLTKKIVRELAEFDNVYFEVCNEPYFGGVTLDWQRHIAKTIADAEKGQAHRHLISMNIANGAAKVNEPPAEVSIFNFHYANPPDAVGQNYALGKVIGENETGFKGTGDAYYRMEAWEFMLAGGGLFSHLDYSFTVGHEDGTFKYPSSQPGGGTTDYRNSLTVLHHFLDGLPLVELRPARGKVKNIPGGAHVQALEAPGKVFALYALDWKSDKLELELPAGEYRAEWTTPTTGKVSAGETVKHRGGTLTLKMPDLKPDVVLKLKSASPQ